MRISFNSDVPLGEQVARNQKRKQKGHKHGHTVGPGKGRPNMTAIGKNSARDKRRKNTEREYWRKG